MGTQSSSSGAQQNTYFRQATDALYASLQYHEEIKDTFFVVQAQSQRVRDASRALHARLQGILEEVAERQADEEFKDYQYPEPSEVGSPESPELEDLPSYSPIPQSWRTSSPLGLRALPRSEDVPPGVHEDVPPGPEVVGEVGSHVSESGVESFVMEFEEGENYRIPFPVIAPVSDGFSDQLECYEVFDADHVAPPVLPAEVLPPAVPAQIAAAPVPHNGSEFCSYCRAWGHQYSLASCVGGVEDVLQAQGGHLFASRARDDRAFLRAKRKRG